MALIETPYTGVPYTSRQEQPDAREAKVLPVVPRVTDIVFTQIVAEGDRTITPVYRQGELVTLDRNGHMTIPWHGDEDGQASGPAAFGYFGMFTYNALGTGKFATTLDITVKPPLPVPTFWDFAVTPALVQTTWFLGGENEPRVTHPGFNITVPSGLGITVLGDPAPGKDVFLVDQDRVTTVAADVTNAILVGRCRSPVGLDNREGASSDELWWIDLDLQDMPPVPA